MEIITFQQDLRPTLPNVYGTLDYRLFRDTLYKIDEILNKSGFEKELITQAMNQYVEKQDLDPEDYYTSKQAAYQYKVHQHALRCNIARC